MTHLRALANMGVVFNSTHLGEWPLKIGQFILNFGAIELISYQHLNALEPTREVFNLNADRLLSQRLDRIQTLLEQSTNMSRAEKETVNSLWAEARALSMWRNRIAHNPVLPTWKPGSDSEHDPPDLMGIPDMKQVKVGDVSDSISLDGLQRLIDETAAVAGRLHAAAPTLR